MNYKYDSGGKNLGHHDSILSSIVWNMFAMLSILTP